METLNLPRKKRKLSLRQLLARLLFWWSVRLIGCKTQEERETFALAWVMAIKVVHDVPEAREAARRGFSGG